MNLLITGYYDHSNLGDDLFKQIASKMFKPNQKLQINTIKILPIEKINSDNIYCDALILFGGDVLNSYFLNKLIKFKETHPGIRLYAIGVGCDEAYDQITNKIYMFDYIIFRNKPDYEYFKNKIGNSFCEYAPDIVHSLSTPKKARRNKTVAFFPAMPIYYHLSSNIEKTRYINSIRELIQFWINKDYNIHMFPMCTNGKEDEDDYLLIKIIIDKIDPFVLQKIKLYKNNTDIIKEFPNMKYAICWRFHSAILSILNNTPFITLSSTKKVINLLKDNDIEEQSYTLETGSVGCEFLLKNHKFLKHKLKNIRTFLFELSKKIYSNPYYLSIHRQNGPYYLSEKDINTIVSHLEHLYIINRSKHDTDFNANYLLFYLTRDVNTNYFYGLRDKLKQGISIDKLNQDIRWLINDLINKADIHFYYSIIKMTNHKIYLESKSRPTVNMLYINQFEMKGLHRSGWSYVLDNMLQYHHPNSILCDFYLDRTFHWNYDIYSKIKIIPYIRPWIGFIHHTMDTNYTKYNTTSLLNNTLFLESLKYCKALIVLSDDLRNKIYKILYEKGFDNINIYSLTHPTESINQNKLFSFKRFKKSKERRIIQIGAWMRDINAIFKLKTNPSYLLHKYALIGKKMEGYYQPQPIIDSHNTNDIHSCMSRDQTGRLVELNDSVKLIHYLSNDEYDTLLSNNVVFIKLIEASAVNTLIECIMRNTPIVINKLPSIIELLGNDYPLLYDDIEEVYEILTLDNIKKAYKYLKHMNKSNLSINLFKQNFTEILKICN